MSIQCEWADLNKILLNTTYSRWAEIYYLRTVRVGPAAQIFIDYHTFRVGRDISCPYSASGPSCTNIY